MKNIQGKIFKENYENPEIFKPTEIDKVIDKYLINEPVARAGRKGSIINVPCAFDIETTSFEEDGEERAIMYHWQLGLNGAVILGRRWYELTDVLDRVSERLELGEKKHLLIYVHNLSFEFQWIMFRFQWTDVFATDMRKPLKAATNSGIEFRCSLRLSGYGLEKTGENLANYKCRKMSGDLDYDKIRNSKTKLTEKEIQYCINDVVVVMCYIQEQIEYNDGKITKIPLTNTGYIRRRCREACLPNGRDKASRYQREKYEWYMYNFQMTEEEYRLLRWAYQGGFTHANAKYVGRLLEKVTSFDFTSSYPAVMIAEKYPSGNAQKVRIKSVKQLEKLFDKYCVLIPITYKNIRQRKPENIISASKCIKTENAVVNNGKIVSADYITLVETEVDYKMLKAFYKYDAINVTDVLVYHKAYLPTPIIEVIAELYVNKTKLKGIDEKKTEYQHSKGELNSTYGMCGTDPVRDLIEFIDEWGKTKADEEITQEQIDDYNNNKNRFLHYSWAVWITAYSRRNLFSAIYECGDDYVYSDTDSVKIINAENHEVYFKRYAKNITKKIETACKIHKIDPARFHPKTIKGKEKPIGVWDNEGTYDYFKTLGAKRYMVCTGEEVEMTVSGINKEKAVPWMLEETNGDIFKMFDMFDFGLSVPANASGKNIHKYFDKEITGTITDYQGNTETYHELSGVWLGATGYNMSITDDFSEFLLSLIDGTTREIIQ